MTPRDASEPNPVPLHLVLYPVGLVFWAWVVGWGRTRLDVYDWPIFTQYWTILLQAVRGGVIPFHAYLFREDLGVIQTEYFARVHLMLAPHILLLLRFLDVTHALVVHVLLNYTVGYVGLVKLCRENRLDRLSFAWLFTVLFLGGFVVSKLVVGQVNDLAYFLFPYFILYCQRLLRSRSEPWWSPTARDTVIRLSFLIVYSVLQAGLHVVHIFVLVLLLLLLTSWTSFRRLAVLGVLVAWGGAVRFAPTLAFTQGYLDPSKRGSWTGYGTWVRRGGEACSVRSPTCWLSELTRALGVVTPVNYPNNGFWELDTFIGLSGIALLAGGLALLATRPGEIQRQHEGAPGGASSPTHRILGLSGLVIAVLTLGPIYAKIFNPLFRMLHLPHVNDMPTHMIVYPLLLAAGYAAAAWQWARTTNGRGLAWLQVGLVVVTMLACVEHAAIWNVGYVERHAREIGHEALGYRETLTFEAKILDRPVSPWYRTVVYGSGAASAVYLAAVAVYAAGAAMARRRAEGRT